MPFRGRLGGTPTTVYMQQLILNKYAVVGDRVTICCLIGVATIQEIVLFVLQLIENGTLIRFESNTILNMYE